MLFIHSGLFFVKNYFSFFRILADFIKVKDSLVAASAEFQGEIIFSASMNSPSTRVSIQASNLVSVFGVDFSAGDEVYIIEISGVAPDIFLRVAFFDLLQESCEFFLDSLARRVRRLGEKIPGYMPV